MGFGSASFVISYFPFSRVLVGRDVKYKYNSCSMVDYGSHSQKSIGSIIL